MTSIPAARLLAPLSAGVLMVTVLSAVPSGAAAPPVIARTATLTQRGVTPSGAAAQQLASATVRQDLKAATLSGTFVLRAAPGAGSELVVAFGRSGAAGCQAAAQLSTPTTGQLTAGFSRSGSTIRLSRGVSMAAYQDWNCAFAVTRVPGSVDLAGIFDVLGGSLTDVLGKPRLAIAPVEMLGQRQPRLRLVPGVWTKVDVTVRNSGDHQAAGVTVTGAGKGLRVRRARLGTVNRGGQASGTVQVRLVGKRKKSALRLRARGGGVVTTRVVRVSRAPAPRRPVAGRYRSQDGAITFRVKNGRVADFRAKQVRMRCQAPLDYATYSTVNLAFPRTTIPRSGVVDADKRYRKGNAWYNATLQMRVNGARIRQGTFSYVTANWCSVRERFTARRVGR